MHLYSSPNSDKTNQDQRPGKLGPVNKNSGFSLRPPARGVLPVKLIPLDLKTLKEKDSREVLNTLNEGIDRLNYLLQSAEKEHNSDEFIYDLTCALARACEAPSGENTNKILAAVKDSDFLTLKIPSFLDRVDASEMWDDHISLQRLIECLIVIFVKYLTIFRRSYADPPYDKLKLALGKSSIETKKDLEKKLEAFKESRDGIIKSEREKQGKRYRVGEKPPNDFRDMPIYPMSEEITTQERPFLRMNISKGRYDNVEHYLDVQFRLLREDFLEPLREGIGEVILNVPRQQRKHLLKNYRSVRIIGKELAAGSGITYQVEIDVSGLKTSRWPDSKRLMYGSFLCISHDNFQTMLFATVSKREPEELKKGRIDIQFIEEQDIFGIESRNYVYQMVESPAYFEAYRYVLKGLKQLNETTMPFKKYLVECSAEVDPPEYLRRSEKEAPVCFDLRDALDVPGDKNAKAVPVLTPGAWPSVATLPLNRSQLEALRTAITTEFSVIQGPPGTGKTYVGAKIVRCLLENRRTWDPQRLSPMLMVCYTNHALDQFLEKVLEFLPQKEIIRVGQRSKSPMLEVCNLKHFTHEQCRGRVDLREVIKTIRQKEREQKDWEEHLEKACSELLELDDLEDVLNPDHLDQLYNAIFPSNAKYKYRSAGDTFILWLCDDEPLRSCNQNTTEESPAAVSDVSSFQDIGASDEGVKPPFFFTSQDDESESRGAKAFVKRVPSFANDPLVATDPWALINAEELSSDATEFTNNDCASKKENCVDRADEVNGAGEETIAIGKEADFIQCQRRLQVEENLSNVASGDAYDLGAHDEDNDGWTTVTYKRKQNKKFAWLQTEDEGSKERLSNMGGTKKKKRNATKILSKENISELKDKLKKETMMSPEEAMNVGNIWNLSRSQRLQLYHFWIESYRDRYRVEIQRSEQDYRTLCEELKEVKFRAKEEVLRRATVIGMTTTGAAKYHSALQRIAPRIVVIEEAAEVMESHIITSLSHNTKHTILIGDHKQLRPKATVYELARKYNLEVSLFERMVMNNVDCKCLSTQHRMRPEIAALTKRIYDHEIKDHSSVCQFEDISGVCRNLFFINHGEQEKHEPGLQSYSNFHEASFLVALCRHLLLQGYNRSQITILTMYIGQLLLLKEIMSRQEFSVRICVVDNFQGEENDIILLSLVRSNSQRSIGFLGESNRICVALSRARKGLYCIGNFSLLKSKCELWKEICDDLETKGAIGHSLQLICKRHNNVTSVQNAGQFNSSGGCNMPCGDRLDCGHACTIPCHTRIHPKNCPSRCVNICYNEHQCKEKCHYPVKCPPCYQQMPKTVPKCDHEQLVPCCIDPEKFSCRAKCEKELPCGHPCQKPCGQLCTTQCRVTCEKSLPCGHEKSMLCYQDPVFYNKCTKSCNKLLACGHPCSRKCTQSCQCNTTIEVQMSCKHWTRVLCREKDSPSECHEKCERVLNCGHDCPGICHEDCRTKQCKIIVVKDLPCDHQQAVPCFQDPKEAVCFAPCLRQLDCGHNCSSACGLPCHEVRCKELCKKPCARGHPCQDRCHSGSPCSHCTVEVDITLPKCGHNVNSPCYVDPSSIMCVQPCKRVRKDCGHPCKGTCYKNCEARPCKEPVTRILSCNHAVNLPCHKNPEKIVCKEKVKLHLACGHKAFAECHVKKTGIEHVLCKERIEKRLRCGHTISLPCFKKPEDCICRRKVELELPCGHKKSARCSTISGGLPNDVCTVKVSRKLACGHETALPCHRNPLEHKCQEEIEILLDCGHHKRIICCGVKGEMKREMCTTNVWKKLPCGHDKLMRCSSKTEEVFCDAPCERFLSCGHQCSHKCGEQCDSFNCVVEVEKDMSCGYHRTFCFCSEDVSQLICSNPCKRNLKCGHPCPGKCFEECSQHQCPIKVVKRLSCTGKHSMKMYCKEDPKNVACKEDCTQLLACGHPCPGVCSQPCERYRCKHRVDKTFDCGHEVQSIPCFQFKTATCSAPCPRRQKCKHRCKGVCGESCEKYPCQVVVRKTLKCGHNVAIRCSDSVDKVQCSSDCIQKLPCGHQCSGTCAKCSQRGSHEICQHPCGRLLVCCHRCQAKCSEPCPPCNKKCGRRCPHKKCTQSCSQSCTPCKKPCKWSCPHYTCNNLCGEECDRPRCNAPCPKRLPCRHPCIGLCGENCPTVCAICHAKKLPPKASKTTETTRYLQLFDCNHIVEVDVMDRWMLRDLGNDVRLIQCPRCSVAITFSYRYGNQIKEALKNIDDGKDQIYKLSQEASEFCKGNKDSLKKFRQKLQMMEQSRKVSLTFTLRNHLLIIDEVKKGQSCLRNMKSHQGNSKEQLAIKDFLEKMTAYLEKPQFDLSILNTVYEHARKFFLYASILEAQSEAINFQRSFSDIAVSRLKLAQQKFHLFIQGTDDALEVEWLERIVASVRKEVGLLPPATEEPKEFENVPGFNIGTWKLCEHREVYVTRSLMRNGELVTKIGTGCRRCVPMERRDTDEEQEKEEEEEEDETEEEREEEPEEDAGEMGWTDVIRCLHRGRRRKQPLSAIGWATRRFLREKKMN